MKWKSVWHSLTIFGFVVAFGCAQSQAALAFPRQQELSDLVGTLEVASGEVEVLLKGSEFWKPTSGRLAISAGDAIRTNDSGAAFLFWLEDGTWLEIEPNTWLYINEFKGSGETFSIEITLAVGRIFNRIQRLSDAESRYQVNTPTMETSVRGTVFGIDVSPDLTSTLVVNEGSVAGTQGTPASSLVEVKAGFWVRSALKNPVGTPLSFAEADNDPVVLALIAGGEALLNIDSSPNTPLIPESTTVPTPTAEPASDSGSTSIPPDSNDDSHEDTTTDDSNDDASDDANPAADDDN